MFFFGLTTALNYAASGMLDWPLAGAFIAGGFVGSMLGTGASRRLSAKKGTLNAIFATMILIVACYTLYKSWAALSG